MGFLKIPRKEPLSKTEVRRLFGPLSGKNEYLLIQGPEAAAIDIDQSLDELEQVLADADIALKFLLVTHAHGSHIRSLRRLKEKFGGKLCLHEHDYELLKKTDARLEPDLFIRDGQKLPLGEVRIKVLHTPGHTPGSVCFWLERAKLIFSGSTLLKGGYGKIWGNSSMSLMLFSLKRLSYTLSPDTLVYPRSGEPTVLRAEAWIDCLRSH
jgi:glyoxylase-like metal-dependent hydrolase (beta-lactamase superfamily II)